MNYTLNQIGNGVISSIFGGEGLGMKFTGPGYIYIQSKNINDLCSLIDGYITAKSSTFQGVNIDINPLKMLSYEGGTKKTTNAVKSVKPVKSVKSVKSVKTVKPVKITNTYKSV